MSSIGVDLKDMKLSTYQRITGLNDKNLAQIRLTNAWDAVDYLQSH